MDTHTHTHTHTHRTTTVTLAARMRAARVKNDQKVGMLLQKRTDTRGVGISSMYTSLQPHPLATPISHTHIFHPLPLATPTSCSPHPLATPIHSTHSPQLSSILLTRAKFKVMDDNYGEWVESMGVVVRRYIDFLILLIPTPLVSVLFLQQHPYFLFIKKKLIICTLNL